MTRQRPPFLPETGSTQGQVSSITTHAFSTWGASMNISYDRTLDEQSVRPQTTQIWPMEQTSLVNQINCNSMLRVLTRVTHLLAWSRWAGSPCWPCCFERCLGVAAQSWAGKMTWTRKQRCRENDLVFTSLYNLSWHTVGFDKLFTWNENIFLETKHLSKYLYPWLCSNETRCERWKNDNMWC